MATTPTAAPRRPAAYLRVSSKEQVEGYSLEAQERAIRAFCAGKGWPDVALYIEPGKSAYTDVTEQRPAFARLLAATERGDHDVVIVHKLDRFARSLLVTLKELGRLERAGVAFASVSEQMDFSTPIGRVMLAMLGAFAQYYSDNLSTEVKKGLSEIVAQGGHIGGVPYGAMRDEQQRLIVNPDKAATLRAMLELVAERGDSGAATELTRRGLPGPRGATWRASTVYKVIRRGVWLLDQPAPWPQLWSAARTRPRLSSVNLARQRYMLTGLVRCACGAPLIYGGGTNTTPRRPGLQCRAKPTPERPSGAGCVYRRRLADHYEALVTDWIQALPDLRFLPPLPAMDVASARQHLTERRRLLGLALIDQTITEADYRQRLGDLVAEEAALPLAEAHQPAVAAQVWQLQQLWPVMTPTEQNDALRALLERVVVRGDSIEVEPIADFARLLSAASELSASRRKRCNGSTRYVAQADD